MGKEKSPRRVAENEAMAVARMLRTSDQKLNLVAQMIRGKKVEKALADLTFSKKRIAADVKKTLQSAIANAENNHGLDVDELYVAEAWVGKNITLKRGRPRARGRFGKILKPFSQLTIKVRHGQMKLQRSKHNGSEDQSDRLQSASQPHLGQPLVRQQP